MSEGCSLGAERININMERKSYLNLCQEVALTQEQYGIRRVPDELKVIYEGIPYYPVAYELSFGSKGDPKHFAILHDLNANSITKAKLQDVDKCIKK